MIFELTRQYMGYVEIVIGAINALMALLVLKRCLPVKGVLRHIVLYVALHVAANTIIWLGDASNILGCLLVLLVAICLCCGGRVLARFSVGLVLFSLMMSTTAVLCTVRPPMDQFLRIYQLLMWVGVYLFVRRAMPADAVQPIRQTRLWLLVDVLALMPFGCTYATVALTELTRTYTLEDEFYDPLMIYNEKVLIVVLALAAVSALALFVAMVVLGRHEKLEEEQMLWQMRRQYYTNLEQGQQQVRRLRHDMANHFVAMAGLSDEAMRDYLNNLLQSPAMSAGQRFCENEVVNAVFTSKMPILEEGRIQTELELALPAGLPLKDVDLCAVYANCLDNAIEASSKLPPEQRQVRIHTKADKGLLMLRLENNMEGKLAMRDGVVLTSKKDMENHGFGLSGMRDIVQRYNGSMEVGQVGQTFKLLLTIPLGQSA